MEERPMSHKTQTFLASTSAGRIILHIATALRDHKLLCHLKGIKREIISNRNSFKLLLTYPTE
jgi:hypothetical protein